MELYACPMCRGETKLFIQSTADPADFFGGGKSYKIADGSDGTRLPVYTCRSCEHGHTPLGGTDPAAIVRWYQENEPDEAFLADESARRKTAAVVLERIEAFCASGGLLDIGAGPGVFVSEAKKRGWDAVGLEPSRWGVEYAREAFQVQMQHGDFSEVRRMSDASYDVVTIFDVIEHVADPEELLKGIHRILRPGGLLVITTPRLDSLFARLTGRRWHAIFPAHLHYFTTRSLYSLLKEAGFLIERRRTHTRYLGSLYFWRRLVAYLGIANMEPVKKSSPAIPINVGDEFEVYARK